MTAPRRHGGESVKISTPTYARVVLACEQLKPKMTVSDWMEQAALASLKRQKEAQRIKAYEQAVRVSLETLPMTSPRRQGGESIKISTPTYAHVVLACEQLKPKMTVSDWMERAALASLKRQEEAQRIKAYEQAVRVSRDKLTISPYPPDYGLPADYGISSHEKPSP
jgi:uncharacterized protein YfeS